MNDKALSTRLIHNGDGQYYKKMASYQSIPEVLPIYNTSVFAFDDVPSVDAIYDHEAEGYIYSRIRHPNSDAVSEILASADEGEDALVFSSGMSAIVISVLSVVSPGDHILSSPVLYGGVHGFFQNELKRFGIDVTFVDFNAEDIEKYIRPNTKLLYTETICNPLMAVPDIPRLSQIARRHGLLFFIDNTFATSVVAKPLTLDADVVLYSATKEFLEGHSKIEKVFYPGLLSSPDHERAAAQFSKGLFGGMISVNLKGGEREASTVIASLPTIKYVPSLAGTATTVSYAAKTSHRSFSKEQLDEVGITYGQLRFSIGLEDAEDIISEIDGALDRI